MLKFFAIANDFAIVEYSTSYVILRYKMDRRIIKTKDAIKTAYINLLIEKKSPKISITELSKNANIDRKTFYLHYNSVDDVMAEILEERLSEFEHIFNEHNDLTDSIDANLVMHSMNICIMKNIEFYRCIVYHQGFEHFAKQLKELLVQKTISVLLPSSTLSEREIRIYCRFLFSGIIDVYADWFQNNSTLTLDDLGELTSRVIYNGIKVLE